MPIVIHDDKSPYKGVVLFLNAALASYLDNNKERLDSKFRHLNKMLEKNLYLTDLRAADPTLNMKYNEIDIVGFKEKGEPVCFTLQTSGQMTLAQFKENSLERMSEASQKMIKDIQEKLGFVEESDKPIIGPKT